MGMRTRHKLPLGLCPLPPLWHSGGQEELCRGRGPYPQVQPPPRQSSVRSAIFIVPTHRADQAPSGAACQRSGLCCPEMPLLTELERGLVGPRFYKYAAPSGAGTRVPRCGTSVPGQAQAGRERRHNFLAFPAGSGWAKSLLGVSGARAARPAAQISCNNSARLPLYGTGGGVRPTKQSMNAMNRSCSSTRPVAFAALAGPALGRLGAGRAGCRVSGGSNRILSDSGDFVRARNQNQR